MNKAVVAGSAKQGATVPRFHRVSARWIDHEPRPESATTKRTRTKIRRFFESAEYGSSERATSPERAATGVSASGMGWFHAYTPRRGQRQNAVLDPRQRICDRQQ